MEQEAAEEADENFEAPTKPVYDFEASMKEFHELNPLPVVQWFADAEDISYQFFDFGDMDGFHPLAKSLYEKRRQEWEDKEWYIDRFEDISWSLPFPPLLDFPALNVCTIVCI